MRPTKLLIALFMAGVLSGPALGDDAYLFDLLKQQPYRDGWNAMFKGEKNVPKWITVFAKTYNGVATPAKPVDVEGQSDLLTSVCKPHDCGDNQLFVLFAPKGASAWGMLLEAGKDARWFGSPDDAAKAVLRSGPET
jgi:Inhibitor of vertebrate lysozyme (Ivy)